MTAGSDSPAGQSVWSRFWFADTSLARLGAFRMLMCGLAMYDVALYRWLVFQDAAAVSAGGAVRPWTPIYLFDVLGVQPIGTATAEWVFVATLVALGMGMVGLFSRVACLCGVVLFVYWTGLAYSFGKPHHDKVALTFALIALPWAPVGARLSVDALIARFRRAGRGGDPAEVPVESQFAGFPIRFAQVSVALGYFFAGGSKLYKGGTEWLNGYSLQGIMMGHNNTWSAFFSQSVLFARVSSMGLVLTQLCFPLVFVWRRLLWYFVPVATLFHLITWQTMDTGPYMRLWFVMAAFVPLERVPAVLRGWLCSRTWRAAGAVLLIVVPAALVLYVLSTAIPPWILAVVLASPAVAFGLYLAPGARVDLVFDGSCRLCRRTLAVVFGLDWGQRVRPLDLQHEAAVRAVHPELDLGACARDMHAVTAGGAVTTGFGAYRTLCWRLPLLCWLAPLLYLAPVAAVGRRVYRHAADRRLAGDCGGDVCDTGDTGDTE